MIHFIVIAVIVFLLLQERKLKYETKKSETIKDIYDYIYDYNEYDYITEGMKLFDFFNFQEKMNKKKGRWWKRKKD